MRYQYPHLHMHMYAMNTNSCTTLCCYYSLEDNAKHPQKKDPNILAATCLYNQIPAFLNGRPLEERCERGGVFLSHLAFEDTAGPNDIFKDVLANM